MSRRSFLKMALGGLVGLGTPRRLARAATRGTARTVGIEITLPGSARRRVAGYAARPATGTGPFPVIVLAPGGSNDPRSIRQACHRWAEAGYAAIAPLSGARPGDHDDALSIVDAAYAWSIVHWRGDPARLSHRGWVRTTASPVFAEII